jgi:transcriptional regulatory protein LevR
MVSTSLVLEALRKASILDMDLESIYISLKGFRGYNTLEAQISNNDENKNNAIVTICATGEGTAVKLKELVEKIVLNTTKDEIEIFPVSVSDLVNKIVSIKQSYNIIACVGIKNPNVEAPFISLEELINGYGEITLMSIIKNNSSSVHVKHKNVVAKNLCEDSLKEFLTYLNPPKIINVLNQFMDKLEENNNISFNNATRIIVMVHLGCALERMVINHGLKYKGNQGKLDKNKVNILKEESKIFIGTLDITLSDDEIFFLSEMI